MERWAVNVKELSIEEEESINSVLNSSLIYTQLGSLINKIIKDLNLLWEIVADVQLENMDFGRKIITKDDLLLGRVFAETSKTKIDGWMIQVHDSHGNKLDNGVLSVLNVGDGVLEISGCNKLNETDVVCWVVY